PSLFFLFHLPFTMRDRRRAVDRGVAQLSYVSVGRVLFHEIIEHGDLAEIFLEVTSPDECSDWLEVVILISVVEHLEESILGVSVL
ncbi:hypothetical protein PENTCL1PPCAC_8930, partial [Pristionchus entomophagus]